MAEQKTYSLSAPPKETPTYSVSVDTETPVQGNALENRALRYHYTLGDDSPGYEEIKANIASGVEDKYQEKLVSQEMGRRAEAGKQLAFDNVQAGNIGDPLLISALADPGNPPNKATILEEQYAKKTTDSLLTVDPESAAAKAIAEDPMALDGALAGFETIQKKNLVIQKWKNIADAKVANTGWVPWAGYQAMQMVQFPTWLNIIPNREGGPESSAWYTAGALDQKVQEIHAMDPDEMDAAIKAEVESLAAVNPLDARKFVDALIGYGASDRYWDIVGDVSMLPLGTAAKAGKLVKAAGKVDNVAKGVAEAVQAGKAAPASGVAEDMAKAAQEAAGGRGTTTVVADGKTATATGLKDPVQNELESITRAVSSEGTDIPTVLSGTGKPELAARYLVRQKLAQEFLPNAPEGLQRQFAREAGHLLDWVSTKIKNNPGDNNYAKRAVDMEGTMRALMDNAKEIFSVANVSRLTEEQFAKVAEAEKQVRLNQYRRLQDALLNVRVYAPGETNVNVGALELTYGALDGSGPFKTLGAAEQAKRAYGFPLDTPIANDGGGFVLKPWSYVGEDNIPELFLTPELKPNLDTWNLAKQWVGGSRVLHSKFQNMQRNAAVHAEARLGEIWKQNYKLWNDVFSGLSKTEKDGVNEIMKINQLEETIPGNPATRGKYYANQAELEDAYRKHLKRLPTEKEVKMYFTHVFNSDLDWAIRAVTNLTQKASQGVERLTLNRLVENGRFASSIIEGRLVDADRLRNAIDNGDNFDVVVVNEKGIVTKHNTRIQGDDIKKLLDEDPSQQIIQPWQPDHPKVLQFASSEEPHPFIIASPTKREPLRLKEQTSYRQGFHNVYPHEHFIKSPKVKNNRYLGDTTIMAFRTEAESRKFGPLLDQARALYAEGKMGEALKFLEAKLPIPWEKFEEIMKAVDPKIPFGYTRHGENISKSSLVDGRKLTDLPEFKNLDSTIDKYYNPSGVFGDPFLSARDELLWTMKNRGTESNPMYELANADLVSPSLAMTQSIGKLIKSKVYNDYQISAAKQFVEEFAGNIRYNGDLVSRENLRRNPAFYLSHGELEGDLARVQQGTALRNSIRELIGQPSKFAEYIEGHQQRVANTIYNTMGEKYVQYIPETAVSMLKNPSSYFRAIAFHSKMGFFALPQLAVQASAATNIVARAPIHGTQAIPAMIGFRSLALTENLAMAEYMGNILSKVPGSGWTKEMFVDAYKLKRQRGFDVVSGSSAWENSAGDPNLMRSKLGHIALDWGPWAFNQGEAIVKDMAWATAYLSHAQKFPKKVGKMTEWDISEIQNRASSLAGNMTRDANSWYQNAPVLSVTTQFLSYNVRIMEQILGKELSTGEKWRLALSQGLLWGATPIGALAYMAQGGSFVNPFTEDLRVEAAKDGKNIDGTAADAIYRGMVSIGYELATGQALDFGGRYGMSMPQTLETFNQTYRNDGTLTAFMVTAMGPSGSTINDFYKQTFPLTRDIYDLVSGEGTAGGLLATDFGSAYKSISGANFWGKVWNASIGARVRNQNGNLTSDGTDFEGDMMKAILGVDSLDSSYSYNLVADSVSEQKAIEQQKKQLKRYSAALYDAYVVNDYEKIDSLKRAMIPLLDTLPLTRNEKIKVLIPSADFGIKIDQLNIQKAIERYNDPQVQKNLLEDYNRRYGN